MTVAEAQSRMSAREFAEWLAYYRLEPWGEERADLRMGILAATLANIHRGPLTKPHSPSDFMPKFDREPKRMTGDQMEAFLRSMTGKGKRGE